MASGTVPASFMGLNGRESGLGFGKSVDFVRISDVQRSSSRRKKMSVIRNSTPNSEITQLEPASEGSPLLGMVFGYHAIHSYCAPSIIWCKVTWLYESKQRNNLLFYWLILCRISTIFRIQELIRVIICWCLFIPDEVQKGVQAIGLVILVFYFFISMFNIEWDASFS